MTEMTSRERVRRALNHQETDRIPIDIGGIHNLTTMHKNAYRKLQDTQGHGGEAIRISSMLSQSVQPDEWVRKRFKADCYPIYTTGPEKYIRLLQDDKERKLTWYKDEFGVTWRCGYDGLYYDPTEPPLKDKSLEEIMEYAWPDPNDHSCMEGLGERAGEIYENTDYAIVLGGPFNGGIYVPCQWWMGYEDFFMDMYLDENKVTYLLDKATEYHIRQWDMILNEAGKYADVAVLSDDLGTQIAPIMDPEIYRRLIKPCFKKVIDFIKGKADDIKIVYHCDGAIRQFLPDFIDLGIDAWNPIQVSADGINDTAELKKQVGDKITFWGAACDSQGTLKNGTTEEIREEVKRRIRDLAPGGGLILASVHNIQGDVPVENTTTFYDALYEFGTAYYQGKL